MADGRTRGDRWSGMLGLIEAVRSRNAARVVAIVRLGGTSDNDHDAELVRVLETEARVIVLTGATPERLDEVRSLFSRPGRVRVEGDEQAAVTAARAAVGPGDLLIGVSSRTGVLWDVMRTPLGAVRRSA